MARYALVFFAIVGLLRMRSTKEMNDYAAHLSKLKKISDWRGR